MTRPRQIDIDEAETIAISALGFLAGDPERLARFMSLSGIGPDELRAQAGDKAMLAAILDYVLGDESLLLVLASACGIAPERIAPAAALLRGEKLERDWP